MTRSGSTLRLQGGALALLLPATACGAQQSLDAIEVNVPARESTARLLEREGDVSLWQLGALNLLHQQTRGRETAAGAVYFMLDAETRSSATMNLDWLTLSRAAWRGSRKYTPQEQLDRMREIAADMDPWAGFDAASLGVHCLAPDLALGLDVLFSAVAHPSFELAFGEAAQTMNVVGNAPGNSRSGEAWALATRSFWRGHPNNARFLGGRELGTFRREDFVKRHSELLDAHRMLVVVVGDIEEKRLLDVVEPFALALPAKRTPFVLQQTPPSAVEAPHVDVLVRKSATFFVEGIFSGPAYGTEDHAAALVATEVLSHRLFERVRQEHGLSYHAAADFDLAGTSYGYVSFSSPDPNRTGRLVLDEIRRLSQTPPSNEETEESVLLLNTWRLQGAERPTAQVSRLFFGHLYTKDWRFDLLTSERLRSVTPAEVQGVIAKYVKNIQFGIVGPHDRVDKRLFESR